MRDGAAVHGRAGRGGAARGVAVGGPAPGGRRRAGPPGRARAGSWCSRVPVRLVGRPRRGRRCRTSNASSAAAGGRPALSTRVDGGATTLADGYATIGAGTRTVGDPATDGRRPDGRRAVRRGDRRGGVHAAHRSRPSGRHRADRDRRPSSTQTRRCTTTARSARSPTPSTTPASGGRSIANADGEEPDAARVDARRRTPGPARQRQAVLGLMDGDGQVPTRAAWTRALLVADPRRPFGVRLDDDRGRSARSTPRGRVARVVLVEASDLVARRPLPAVRRRGEQRPPARDCAAPRRRAVRRADGRGRPPTRRGDRRGAGARAGRRDADAARGPRAGRRPGPARSRPRPGAPASCRSRTSRRRSCDCAAGVDAPTSMEGERAAEPSATVGTCGRPARVPPARRRGGAVPGRPDRRGLRRCSSSRWRWSSAWAGSCCAAADAPPLARVAAAFAALWSLGLLPAAFLVRLVPAPRRAGWRRSTSRCSARRVGAAAVVYRWSGGAVPLDGLLVGAARDRRGAHARRAARRTARAQLGRSGTRRRSPGGSPGSATRPTRRTRRPRCSRRVSSRTASAGVGASVVAAALLGVARAWSTSPRCGAPTSAASSRWCRRTR